jgi:hypothetical protein
MIDATTAACTPVFGTGSGMRFFPARARDRAGGSPGKDIAKMNYVAPGCAKWWGHHGAPEAFAAPTLSRMVY